MSALFQIRRDTTAGWAATPSTLTDGEFGLDTTLKQIKVGDGSSPWGSLPWLGGTLPYFSSPNADIDDASVRVAGLYRYAGIASITLGTVPAAPIDIKAADGGINMMVLPFGTVVLQHLWTDGDGTQPQKSYTRIYDGAWRAWTPQNLWGVSASEGVDAKVRDIEVQQNATVKGTLSTQGSVNIGDSAGDVGVFQQGAVGAPSQTFASDTDTGAYSPAANEYGIVTQGTRRVHVTNALTKVENAFQSVGNVSFLGSLQDPFNINGQLLTNLGAASTAAGAMRLDDLVALSRVSMVYGTAAGPITGSDGTIGWTFGGLGTGSATATAGSGTWRGVAVAIGAGGTVLAIQTKSTDSPAAQFSVSSGSNISGILVLAYRKQ
jgi:hypothetical protein